MGKKTRTHPSPLSPRELKARADRACREQRFQQALQLAKDLYKVEPSPPNRELLRTVCLGRARQLREQGQPRDAQTVLENALQIEGARPAWLEEAAEELAACGAVRRAQQVLSKLPESPAQGRILARAVDTAFLEGPAGRSALPQDLQAPYDLIVLAFSRAEAGQDEQARELLQGIGLQSPFLEWKLLLRGLLAWYQKDDPKALENWQRLSADRLPARLAAPLRFVIDPEYRQAQPPALQSLLQKQADRLQAHPVLQPLRQLHGALATEDGELPRAFRMADGLLPELRQDFPHLVPRLASCFYWSIVNHGQPAHMDRYLRLFGPPPDDPRLDRMQAMALEREGQFQQAHLAWQQFERSVAANPAAWPGQDKKVRALVWYHMGQGAESIPDLDRIPDLPPFLREHPALPKPLDPPAEICFQKSLELDPDQLETHEALFQHHLEKEEHAQAEQAGTQLLERFPEHLPTLEGMAALGVKLEKFADALDFAQRAVKVNPLDRRLRAGLGTAHLYKARAHAETGEFEPARAEYQAALEIGENPNDATVLCKWAACEFKAKNATRAEELLEKARTEAGSGLGTAYSLLIECIRLKLPRPLKARFDKEFKEGLARPADWAAAVCLAKTAGSHRAAGVEYHGQKTHEKKLLAYLDLLDEQQGSEEHLEQLCESLCQLKAVKFLRRFALAGQQRFPQSPVFVLMEAERYFVLGPNQCPAWRVRPLLDRARRLADALPRGPRQQEIIDEIDRRQKLLKMAGIFGGRNPLQAIENLMAGMFDRFGDYEDDGDWDDDDDDDW